MNWVIFVILWLITIFNFVFIAYSCLFIHKAADIMRAIVKTFSKILGDKENKK